MRKKFYNNIIICVREDYIIYIIFGRDNKLLHSFTNCENKNIS
jgi:hypothetical protein